jgi:UDP-3-O-[3-hydroxymyristoyl] glucosamine N-acyltransferase
MTIRKIAEWLGGEVVGEKIDDAPEITNVAKIEEADAGSLTFLANPKYEKHLNVTRATAVLVSRNLDLSKFKSRNSLIFIRVDDPYVAFLRALKHLTPMVDPFASGIHSTAIVPSSATIGKNISIGAYAVIGEQVVVGDNSKIGAGCIIGNQTLIGSDCILYPDVIVYHQCKIGNRVIIQSGAVIGSDGFGFAPKPDGSYEKIPQLGIVVIEDDVEIGANTTVDRATIGDTRIHRGAKIDNLVQIAHNVVIGENTVIAAQTGISGSTKVGKNCMLAGQVGLAGHIEIADRTIIMAQSGVHQNIHEQGKSYFGYPADEARKAQRVYIAMKMLPDMLREFSALQKKVAELEQKIVEKK